MFRNFNFFHLVFQKRTVVNPRHTVWYFHRFQLVFENAPLCQSSSHCPGSSPMSIGFLQTHFRQWSSRCLVSSPMLFGFPANAALPIVVTLSGIVTDVIWFLKKRPIANGRHTVRDRHRCQLISTKRTSANGCHAVWDRHFCQLISTKRIVTNSRHVFPYRHFRQLVSPKSIIPNGRHVVWYCHRCQLVIDKTPPPIVVTFSPIVTSVNWFCAKAPLRMVVTLFGIVTDVNWL